MNRTAAFDGLAGTYEKFRPGYPAALLDRVVDFVEQGRRQSWPAKVLAVDVGSGTGIFSRLLAGALPSASIIGVEPGEGMRATAISSTPPELHIEYRPGAAEALPLSDGSAALVSVAQSVQWFDRPRFYAEAARVLCPGGALAVAQNNRDWQHTPWLAAYESFLEQHNPKYSRHYRSFAIDQELIAAPGFGAFEGAKYRWAGEMMVDDFIGLSSSSTQVQPVVEKLGSGGLRAGIKSLIAEQLGAVEKISVNYSCELYLVRRSE